MKHLLITPKPVKTDPNQKASKEFKVVRANGVRLILPAEKEIKHKDLKKLISE